MTQNYHTPLTIGAPANAATVNGPLGQLDSAIAGLATNTALLDYVLSTGGPITQANGAASAAQKVVTVDSTTGFLGGCKVEYALVGGALEYNTVATVDSATQITLTTNIGTGGIANDALIAVVPAGMLRTTVQPEQFINFTSITKPIAPSAVATANAGNLNGNYEYIVTYKGTTYETAWGDASATVSPANKTVNVTVPVSSSSLVTQRLLYRTKAGVAGTYYLVATINDNSTTTYTDNIADAALGAEIEHALVGATTYTAGGLKIDGHYLLRDSGHELAVGHKAGPVVPSTISYNNVYIGENTGQVVTVGTYNTVVGNQSGQALNEATGNTLIGGKAGYALTDADDNTIVGAEAGFGVTTADYNTLLGRYAGYGDHALTTGAHNTFLGYKAGLGSATQRNYLTVIGAEAEGDEDNAIVLGRADDLVRVVGALHVGTAVTLTEMSAPTGTANNATIYTKDNGAGKTQLCCKLGDDVEIILATQA